MEQLFHYLLKVNILWILLYLGYICLLKKLTFYRYNRIYIIGGLLFGLLCPFLSKVSWWQQGAMQVIPQGIPISYEHLVNKMSVSWSYGEAFTLLFVVGGVILAARLLIQLYGIHRIYQGSKESLWEGYRYQQVFHKIAPFSFFHRIFIHPESHSREELKQIMVHEYLHVRGFHSLDRLFMAFCCILCWFNPLVWMLQKELVENLEFLTDEQVVASGINKKAYQYSLVAVANNTKSIYITNTFSFLILKKRIMMMNKKKSRKIALTAYALLVPGFLMAGGMLTLKQMNPTLENVLSKSYAPLVENAVENSLAATDTLKNKKVSPQKISFSDDISGNVKGVSKSGTGDAVRNVNFAKDTSQVLDPAKKPIVYLGDKEITMDEMKAIMPEEIQEIIVYKDAKAVELFGEKAKHGVIKIILK
ncbi:M56 family metallopeptidase [Sphingobacteriaceae bacterium WQ 2009]|uniref:M56 family metallopeptidase n=1 Tax=Rhinopithecimicrobium faecis TaxID=2820698 RepID=A0A8T4H5J5_9SPHI|nr:M56 family metallopeptidase [Sphingobacteriaceae bacterium WQ 2009]